jgi:ABC-type glycerol-3-phosphate transport system permease component
VTNTVLVAVAMVVTIAPVVYLIYTSLIHPDDYFRFGVTFPLKRVSLVNYRFLLTSNSRIVSGFVMSIYVTVVGVVLSTAATAMLAYPLSKRYLALRVPVTFAIFFTMLFNGGIIPTYLLVRGMGLLDTIWSLVLPNLIIVWYLFLFRNFFQALPESLEESARIDGANDISILFRVVLPLSKPILATIGLFYAVSYWNKWFDVLIYINEPSKHTLQLVLRNIINAEQIAASLEGTSLKAESGTLPSEVLKMTAIVISTVPILLVYPFVQKHFVKGVLVGSIKG